MRILNKGQAKLIFNGGVLESGKVIEFKGDAQKIGAKLLKTYPNILKDLDNEKLVTTVLGEDTPTQTADDELAKLREEANALGIQVHHKAGVETLQKKIAEAKAKAEVESKE